MWMGDSVNLLLPVATIGGDLVKVRQLVRYSVPSVDAVTSIVLDKTVHLISVLLWALVGLVALVSIDVPSKSIMTVLIGLSVFAVGLAAIVVIQWAGAIGWSANFAAKISQKYWIQNFVDSAANVDAQLSDAYRRPNAMFKGTALKLCARMVMAGEVWLAAYLMGYPIGVLESIVLKSLSVAIRNAAFVVPGALGIQEGSFIVLGAIIGLPSDLMLSVSLATRLRELVASVPGILVWQYAEGRKFLRR